MKSSRKNISASYVNLPVNELAQWFNEVQLSELTARVAKKDIY